MLGKHSNQLMNQLHQMRTRLKSGELQKELTSFGVSHVSIFGSYARSEANKESDLDLLIDVTPES
jgi:predicted nucleotidyltransferase